MASLYTKEQRRALDAHDVYDYFYNRFQPKVPYGKPFWMSASRQEVSPVPDGVQLDEDFGYTRWFKNYHTHSLVDAVMDFEDISNPGEAISRLCEELNIPKDVTVDMNYKPKLTKNIVHYANLFENYKAEYASAVQREEGAKAPIKTNVGDRGYSAKSTIVRYMLGRGIDKDIAENLINTGLVYLMETQPYYEMEKDDKGNFIRNQAGGFVYKLDKDGNKIPQIYVDKDGTIRQKMQYNIVFASKDQSKERAFFERKPIGKRGKAFIVSNSSPFGYFSFTGGLEGFKQENKPQTVEGKRKAYICEAPIDAISLYALHKKMGMNEPAEYISISGCGKHLAIERAICEGYDCILAFDNDEKGKRNMDGRREPAFINPYTMKEVKLPCIVPPQFEFTYNKYKTAPETKVVTKDWNDILIAMNKGYNHSIDPKTALMDAGFNNPKVREFEDVQFEKKQVKEFPKKDNIKPYDPFAKKTSSKSKNQDDMDIAL